MFEQSMASLHAGLIERAQPRSTNTHSVVSLVTRANDPARITPKLRAGLVQAPIQRMPESPRRYALTVRVEPKIRRALASLTKRTGRTTQSVLHDALQSMLQDPSAPRRPRA